MSDKFTYRAGPKDDWEWPVASGLEIEIGDLLMNNSGKARPVSGATDNLNFIGVAKERHESTEGSGSILVYKPNALTVFEYDLDSSTTITIGDGLQISGEQELSKNETDSIAHAVESKLSASKIKCSLMLTNQSGEIRFVGDAS